MSRKCKLLNRDDVRVKSTEATAPCPTDWNLCFLCQSDDCNQSLICPANARTNNSGYVSIAKNLYEFDNLGCTPMNINIKRLDDGDGISATLLSHNASYHKSCYLKCNNTILKRAKDKSADRKFEPSPKKTRASIGNVDAPFSDEQLCFFCDQYGGELHRASTKAIDARVRECATKLQDSHV